MLGFRCVRGFLVAFEVGSGRRARVLYPVELGMQAQQSGTDTRHDPAAGNQDVGITPSVGLDP